MPPPRYLLTSRAGVYGYVCRSCLLKSKSIQIQQTPWLSRGYAKRKKQSEPTIQEASVSPYGSLLKVFEEDPDGNRRDVTSEQEDLERMREEFSDVERVMDDLAAKHPDLVKRIKEEGLDALDPEQIFRDIAAETSPSDALKEGLAAHKARFEARLRSFGISQDLDLAEVPDKTQSTDATTRSTEGSLEISTPNQSMSSQINLRVSQFPKAYQDKLVNLMNTVDAILSGPRKSPRTARRKPKRVLSSAEQLSHLTAELWRHYLLSRLGLLSKPQDVPKELWTILWDTFEAQHVNSVDRLAHLHYVGKDMKKAGVEMNIQQQLHYIEAEFVQGSQDSALEIWRQAKDEAVDSVILLKEYWELGIRMLSGKGAVEDAVKVAENLLRQTDDPAAYRLLIPIIKGCFIHPKVSTTLALALYTRLRIGLGDAIEMHDYDAVAGIFLEADCPDLALIVFKDMMLTGDPAVSQHDSRNFLKVIPAEFSLAKVEAEAIDWEKSETLKKLPAKFNNKFFFGSWIKKLIGDGDLESAKKVFDLMQDRGIQPSSIQMNGLIGAWFRDGGVKYQAQADEQAWGMIEARIDFVKVRDQRFRMTGPVRPVLSHGKNDYRSTYTTPMATLETFTILLQQYRRRQKPELIVELFDAMNKAQIPPDTIFMNELLWMETRDHSKGRVWRTYIGIKDNRRCQPNWETFTILWQNMKKQVDPVIGRKAVTSSANFTTCRLLFAEMIKYSESLLRSEECPQELYDLVILCFSYEQDQAGTAVALRALHNIFGVLPNEETVRSVVLQISRLGLVNDRGQHPRRLTGTKAKQQVLLITKVMQGFKDRRVADLLDQGIVFEQLEQKQKSEETAVLLSRILLYTYEARNPGVPGLSAPEASEKAALEMGVPDCIPWLTEIDGHGAS